MREIVPLLLLVCACGAATWSGRRSAQPVAGDSAAAAANASSGEAADHAFAALESLGGELAPGMRRVAERTTTGERVELLRAGDRDACLRVAFEAGAPMTAKLLDAAGNVLFASRAAAAQGVVPEQGPFCIRKGDAVTASADGPAQAVRWIAWSAP